jgi:hypothetical protein
VDTAYQQGQPLALSLHFGGELAPRVLAEDQKRSQRVLRVTHPPIACPASITSTQLPPPLKLLFCYLARDRSTGCYSRHAPAGATGPLLILRFTDAQSLGVVHLPGPCGGICLDSPPDVASRT